MNRRLGPLLALLAIAILPGAAAGQGDVASPLLPADHWSLESARVLQATGLLPAALPPRSATAVADMAALLADAGVRARESGSPLAGLAEGWLARFGEEFDTVGETSLALVTAAAGLGVRAVDGPASPGLGEFPPDRTGPTPRDEPTTVLGTVELAVTLGKRLSFTAAPVVDADGAGVRRGEAHARLGAWGLSVGRMPVGYGYALWGSPVLSTTTLDRAQLATERPVTLPGPLAYLGPVTFHTFVATMDGDRHPGSPVLWGAAGAVHPHPRFAIEVHRAALIGGEGVTEEITAWSLVKGLIGKHSGVENQIVSVEGRWRLPTESLIALTAYCEFGAEDSSGSFYRVPGVVCGGLAPSLPSLPGVSLGVEGAYFGGKCCGNPGWYRHFQFPGSWATEEAPLGHPLGGEGAEARAHLGLNALGGRLGARISGFRRERREENLFVPGRGGASLGGSAAIRLRIGARGELQAAALLEDGDGWGEERFQMLSRIFF